MGLSNVNRKILFLCAASKTVLHFRVDLIKKFQDNGFSVAVAALDNKFNKEISALGVDFYCPDSHPLSQ